MKSFPSLFLIFILLTLVSCDKKSIVYEIAYSSDISGNPEIYLTDTDGISRIQITTYEDRDGYPIWSPDGNKIVFYAYHGIETWSIYIRSLQIFRSID